MFNKEKIVERFCEILACIIIFMIALLPTIAVVCGTLLGAYDSGLWGYTFFWEFYGAFLVLILPFLVRMGIDLVECILG
ncbi:MAG: hypothetical protein J6W29_01420 [Neisseriaceae bacterium]|nr:hypothetical protein [Neisseriaceae bacterium]